MEDWKARIEIDELNLAGKPVIRGTRVAVHQIISDLAEGTAPVELLRTYSITEDDVRAALAWATDTVWEEVVHLKPRERVSVDSGVVGGKPVIRGTRVPVQTVLGALAGGSTVDEVAKDWMISREDVLAALRYGADSVAHEIVHALPRR
jgi:uncharacterized protein (DUF433 family)